MAVAFVGWGDYRQTALSPLLELAGFLPCVISIQPLITE
jgi:hypothetical protein